ncbi:MAG: ExbD/TolR family protein [Limisphaerales bacterium]|jgi:biopolymer transport protein ExbD
MRFPRHARVFRGPADGFLFAGVLLLLLVIVLLHSRLTFIGGLPIELPEGPRLPGVTNATVTVAVDERGQLYYLNQITSLEDLERGLARAVRSAEGPLTLVLLADRRVSQETLVRLMNVGRVAGVKNALLATRPPVGGGRP